MLKTPTFNDGILNVLEAKDGVILANKFEPIRYGLSTVGVTRFYQAKVSGSEISLLINIPLNSYIKQNDLIELTDFHTGETDIFKIEQLQIKDNNKVPKAHRFFTATLVRTGILYDDKRVSG